MAKKKRPAASAPASAPAARTEPRARAAAPATRRDLRRWIYAALDVVFAVIYLVVVTQLVHTRVLLDQAQLVTLPLFAGVAGAGTLIAGRIGWWMAVIGCGALLLSAVLLIVRIIISAAFLAGVFGGFGQAAAGFAVLAVALIVEVVAIVPLFQLKFLMTRAGRRALGIAPPLMVRTT